MKFAAALLADGAISRDGTITIVNAGINVVNAESLPAPLGLSVGLVIELSENEAKRPFSITLDVYQAFEGHEERIGGLVGEWDPSGLTTAVEGLPSYVPIGIALHPVILKGPGRHIVRVSAGEAEDVAIPFEVIEVSRS